MKLQILGELLERKRIKKQDSWEHQYLRKERGAIKLGHQKECYQKIYRQKVLERVWRKGNPPALLVGMYIIFFLDSYFIYLFLYSRFLLVIYFIHISVHRSIPNSQFTPPPLSPLVTTSLFSMSVSLFLCCK